ncbi:hypothetical protein [Mesorhizobium sp. B2-8-9]|uniref:hypothetical protein n=1 Tax=Mesorhizobium sp. B2-8-9 TaxID=2589899 RepID=UPI00112B3AC8|nr:hypothetical protein [Mesorhizobium sp. B2-8-9]TPI86427.1 hypothetical protein FJ423_00970 [Mesorhizobium sp. B2-8-9]
MSLEEALNRNNELLAEHNDLLKKVLGAAANKAGKTEETAAAGSGKGGKGKADKKEDASAEFDADALKAAIAKAGTWLGEFKDNEADGETQARKDKLRQALDKLGYKLAKDINKAEDVKRFETWVEKQIAAGRITPEPEEAGEEASSEDDI